MTALTAAPARRGRPLDPGKDRAIVKAARALLFARGPRALTMEAVARAAGVSKPTLYSRYACRRELLLAVVAGDAASVFRALHGEPRSGAAVRGDLRAFVADLAAFLCGAHHRRLMQALAEVPQRATDLRQVFFAGPQRTLDALAAYLQRAAARGLLRCPAPPESAELLLGMAMGLDLVRSQYRVPLQRRQAAERARHVARVVDAFLRLHAPAP
jgi:TetR/AcrR family transcriptional repressor of mexJK operon